MIAVLGQPRFGAGAIVGMDYSFTNQFVLGLTGAYSYSNVHTSKARAEGHVNSYYGALYGLLHSRHTFLDFAFIGGYDQFDASRKIKFSSTFVGGISRRAHTNHDGWNVDGHVEGGVIIDQWKVVEIRPFLSFDWLWLREDGFKEHGAHSLNLKVQHADYSMLRSEGGVNLARCFRGKHGVWIPELSFRVIRENRFYGEHYHARFVGQSPTFVVKGLNPDRTLYSPGAGLTGTFCKDRLSAALYYDGEFGDGYSDQMGSFEFSWLF